MAEETLNYNIELNKESLISQLEEVRNLISTSLAETSYANNIPPTAASAYYGSPTGGMYAAPEPIVTQPFSGTNEILANMYDKAAEGIRSAQDSLGPVLRTQHLISGERLQIDPPNSGMALYERGPEGAFQNIMAPILPTLAGFDYNFSGMDRGEFTTKAAQNTEEYFTPRPGGSFFSNMGIGLGGAVGGLIGGPVGAFTGALIGWGVGGGVDVIGQLFSGRYNETKSLSAGFKNIAKQNFGAITSKEADSISRSIQKYAYTPENAAIDIDLDVLQEGILAFSEAGGYANANSASDMKKITEGFTENLRGFANAIKVSQGEAARIMGELEKNLISTTDSMSKIGSRLAKVGAFTGLNPMDVAQIGMQGANMFRGTGATMEQGFDMGLDAIYTAEQIRRSGAAGRALVNDMGGVNSYAMRSLEMNQRFMTSGAGMMNVAAILSNGGMSGGLNDMLSGAGNFLNDSPTNILKLQQNMGEVMGTLGQDGMNKIMLKNALNLVESLPFLKDEKTGKVDQDVFTALLQNVYGLDRTSANALLANSLVSIGKDPLKDYARDELNARLGFINENTYGLGGALKATGQSIANVFMDNGLTNAVGVAYDWMAKKATQGVNATYYGLSGQDYFSPYDIDSPESSLAMYVAYAAGDTDKLANDILLKNNTSNTDGKTSEVADTDKLANDILLRNNTSNTDGKTSEVADTTISRIINKRNRILNYKHYSIARDVIKGLIKKTLGEATGGDKYQSEMIDKIIPEIDNLQQDGFLRNGRLKSLFTEDIEKQIKLIKRKAESGRYGIDLAIGSAGKEDYPKIITNIKNSYLFSQEKLLKKMGRGSESYKVYYKFRDKLKLSADAFDYLNQDLNNSEKEDLVTAYGRNIADVVNYTVSNKIDTSLIKDVFSPKIALADVSNESLTQQLINTKSKIMKDLPADSNIVNSLFKNNDFIELNPVNKRQVLNSLSNSYTDIKTLVSSYEDFTRYSLKDISSDNIKLALKVTDKKLEKSLKSLYNTTTKKKILLTDTNVLRTQREMDKYKNGDSTIEESVFLAKALVEGKHLDNLGIAPGTIDDIENIPVLYEYKKRLEFAFSPDKQAIDAQIEKIAKSQGMGNSVEYKKAISETLYKTVAKGKDFVYTSVKSLSEDKRKKLKELVTKYTTQENKDLIKESKNLNSDLATSVSELISLGTIGGGKGKDFTEDLKKMGLGGFGAFTNSKEANTENLINKLLTQLETGGILVRKEGE